MNTKEKINDGKVKLILAGMFVAIAYLTRFVFHFNMLFLTFEIKDAIIAIGGLILGPLYAFGMSLSVGLLEFMTLSETGLYGLIMNVLAATSFSVTLSLMYRKWNTLMGAFIGLICGVCALVLVMLPTNLVITPLFTGMDISGVVELIPSLLLPFNLIKGFTNAGVVLLLYKPLMSIIRRMKVYRVNDEHNKNNQQNKISIWVVLLSLLIIGVSITIFVLFYNGTIIIG